MSNLGLESIITEALVTSYNAGDMELSLLADGVKHVYHVQRDIGDDWILRAFPINPQGHLGRGADAIARMLLYLERHNYATEWVIPTCAGQPVFTHEGWQLLVTTYVGESLRKWAPEYGRSETRKASPLPPAIYGKLGEALAQLHNLPIEEAASLPKAGMLPARELTWVGGYIDEVADQVPPAYQQWYNELASAVRKSHHCQDLKQVLIHCDPNLGNAAIGNNGDVVFIDWDVVGLGPAVFDLGCLLINCVTEEFKPDVIAIHAVMDGYRQHRSLSALELDRLNDAVPSQILVTLGGYFPSLIKGEVGDDELIYGLTYKQWQAKYWAAAEIVRIAQGR
ncbi:MAG: phosphotransferase [Chloroflexota bacterium]